MCSLFSTARSAKNEREAWKYIKKQTLDRVAPWLCNVLLISNGRLGQCQACLALADGNGNNKSVNSMIQLTGLAGLSVKRVNNVSSDGLLQKDSSSIKELASPLSSLKSNKHNVAFTFGDAFSSF